MSEILPTIINAAVAILVAYIAYRGKAMAKVLKDVEKTGVDTHTLVNSNFGIQLKLNQVSLRRIAEFTGNQEDHEAAELAKAMYLEHVEGQRVVDSRVLTKEQ